MRWPRTYVALTLGLVVGVCLAVGALTVWGFAEEELGFRDRDGTTYPPSGDFPDNRISTVHDDLTYALAIAAGFTVTDSHTLRIWDQLVDSEVLPVHRSRTPTATRDSTRRPIRIWPVSAGTTSTRSGPRTDSIRLRRQSPRGSVPTHHSFTTLTWVDPTCRRCTTGPGESRIRSEDTKPMPGARLGISP